MEILDYLFEKSKPSVDFSDIPDEKTVLDGFEAIRSMLTFSTWNGEPRQLSVLTISYAHPGWQARITDYDNRRSSSATNNTVADAIESLERQLLSKEPRWYNWPDPSGGTKKKGKPATSSRRSENGSSHDARAE